MRFDENSPKHLKANDPVERMKLALDSDEASQATLKAVRRLLSNMAVFYTRHGDPDHICSTCQGWQPKDPEHRARRAEAKRKWYRRRERRERP